MKHQFSLFLFIGLASSCNWQQPHSQEGFTDSLSKKDTVTLNKPAAIDSMLDKKDSLSSVIAVDTLKIAQLQPGEAIDTRNVNPDDVIKFAEKGIINFFIRLPENQCQ